MQETEYIERFERVSRLVQHLLNVAIVALDLEDGDGGGHSAITAWARMQSGPTVLPDIQTGSWPAPLRHEAALLALRCLSCWPVNDDTGRRLGTVLIADTRPRHFDPLALELVADLVRGLELELGGQRQASLDGLTSLLNRRGFERQGEQLFAYCERHAYPLSLMYLDLNGFKQINDCHGHAEGDRALTLFAQILRRCLRSSDLLARLGGDEFAILMPQAEVGAGAGVLARVRAETRHLQASGQTPYLIACSAGQIDADFGQHRSLQALLTLGDEQMYLQKRELAGRHGA
jgi:diguanylate cyclase (GGDEF)-like protein